MPALLVTANGSGVYMVISVEKLRLT